MCVDIKPSLSKSPPQFAHFYPEPIIQHDVSTQADMFLACSSPKEVELEEKEGNPVDMTATTISYNEDTYVTLSYFNHITIIV